MTPIISLLSPMCTFSVIHLSECSATMHTSTQAFAFENNTQFFLDSKGDTLSKQRASLSAVYPWWLKCNTSISVFSFFFMSASQRFPLTNALCVARLLGNSKWMGNSWTIVLHLILHLTRTTWCWSAERHFNWTPETSIFQRVIRSRQMEYHRKLVTFSTVSHFPQSWV